MVGPNPPSPKHVPLNGISMLLSLYYDSLPIGRLSYLSFQPVRNDWPWYLLFCLWDDAYKRHLAANRK